MEHQGRTALVTGAAGAIGSAAVDVLVSAGAHVIILDVDGPALETLCGAHGDAVTRCVVDLSDHPATRDAVQAALAAAPGNAIDILVNNAGILSNRKLAATTLEEWHKVHTINLDAAFVLTQALAPAMAQSGWGRIVNIVSYAAKCGGLTAGTAYSVSKSGLIGLTFSAAREFAGQGVTVNALAPAYVMSPMVSDQLTAEERDALLRDIPVHRFCEPDEVANAIAFLASAKSGFITGEVLDMNGGLQFD
ncbi:SDR family NAD(P)-dependent oxidoreductase [Roseisalinus antarcticus]|uniref:3-oxoacyl-[acyl-carrier-protein] reductase FabG n=1 Tax=Roseisalinus antarcticus TaxID=254357 RepID=A0A1Y5TZF3_9RHOB|nr:SDR family NAD(P)-dependent oxidoreductase [Roseisalinus antarcticus]SLN77492.1 3-oxoacyl-[acyl-carrier-protein] reductase FabG [Roseisalinus antarcticus]